MVFYLVFTRFIPGFLQGSGPIPGPGAVHRGRVVRVTNGALLGATSLLRWAPGAVINRITQGRRRSITRETETWSGLGIMLATPAGSARFL